MRSQSKITIPPQGVVGQIFTQYTQFMQFIVGNHLQGGNMRKRVWQFLIVAVVAIGCTTPSAALATNGHQDHRGACARSTTSISKGVSDLKYNGVAQSFARSMGIHSFDGSVRGQLNNRLTVGRVVSATSTKNTGCDGYGGTFPAGRRGLYKGETVVVKTPAKYGKDVCVKSHKGCHSVVITVHVVLPTSCWNRNTGTIRVRIWVKTHKQPSTKKKTKKKHTTTTPAIGCTIRSDVNFNTGNACQGNSSTQTADQKSTVQNDCKGPNTNSNQCLTTIINIINQTTIQVNANCSKVTITYGNGDTKVEYHDNNGNVVTENYCSTSTTTVVNPGQPSSAACTDFSLETNPAVNLGVIAHVIYTASNATLTSVTYNWGDGTTTTGTSLNESHVFASPSTYYVSATLKFTTPDGTTTATCNAKQVTPKDGTGGYGTGSGGSGSGGTPGTGTGEICFDPNTGLARDMLPTEHKDIAHQCRPN